MVLVSFALLVLEPGKVNQSGYKRAINLTRINRDGKCRFLGGARYKMPNGTAGDAITSMSVAVN